MRQKGGFIMRKKRFRPAPVAVGFIKNEKSELLLVERNAQWTLPTGHMEPDKGDTDLRETLNREMSEELGVESLTVVESLGTIVRNKSSPKAKLMEIFSCQVLEKAVKYYNEGKGRKKMWLRPSQALELDDLDELAFEAISRFFKKYPGPVKKKEKNNEKTENSIKVLSDKSRPSKDCSAIC